MSAAFLVLTLVRAILYLSKF